MSALTTGIAMLSSPVVISDLLPLTPSRDVSRVGRGVAKMMVIIHRRGKGR